MRDCDFCKGSGHVEEVTRQGRVLLTCGKCRGTGKLPGHHSVSPGGVIQSEGISVHASTGKKKLICDLTIDTPGELVQVIINATVTSGTGALPSIVDITLNDSTAGEVCRVQVMAGQKPESMSHSMRLQTLPGKFNWELSSELIKGDNCDVHGWINVVRHRGGTVQPIPASAIREREKLMRENRGATASKQAISNLVWSIVDRSRVVAVDVLEHTSQKNPVVEVRLMHDKEYTPPLDELDDAICSMLPAGIDLIIAPFIHKEPKPTLGSALGRKNTKWRLD